ncbi:MAG TPA: flagellar hook-basal body complex protein [Lachnospiraceae bacterium]|nr:flagellar hook-basal body complex protein [Lachnospiraceae bacterium]
MMRSLYSGVSGLKTHQTKMDVIGNNIANVNTVAYKSQSITFSELMYQTTQNASGPNAITGTAGVNAKQIGLGVQAAAISTSIATAGATQTTGNPFDLKITGDAFFVVSDGSNNYFTRDGSFYVDAVGNLAMSSTGYNVMGWQTDEKTGTIKQDTVTALRIMSAENLTYPPEATSKAYISGIIDKNDTNVATEAGKTLNLGFYDNLGYKYTGKLSMHETETPGEFYMELDDVIDSKGDSITKFYNTDLSNIVNLGATSSVQISEALSPISVTHADGTSTTASFDKVAGNYLVTNYDETGTQTGDFTYSAATIAGYLSSTTNIQDTGNLGVLKSIFGDSFNTSTQAATLDVATGIATITNKLIQGGVIKYNTDTGKFVSANGSAGALTLNFKDSYIKPDTTAGSLLNFSDIAIDMSASTFYNNNGSSTIGATAGGLDGKGIGRSLGEMSGISIQNNGMIYASYTNGQTRLLGQIAVADFANASGLEKQGDNLYSATLNSGEFDGIGTDITANSGSMTTGVLEMSNVDLSTEFTEMITTQRGFQANSRIITVSDTLLEELVNLKR